MAKAMKRGEWLLLGLGNEILGDDGVGHVVAEKAAERIPADWRVDVAATAEAGMALLDHLEFYRGALLVDAVKTEGGRPGEIYELDPHELEGKPVRAPHFIGVGEALALGRTLGFQMPEELRVLAVEAEDLLTLKEGLSPKVSEAADRAVERALEILGEWVSQERRPEKEAQA